MEEEINAEESSDIKKWMWILMRSKLGGKKGKREPKKKEVMKRKMYDIKEVKWILRGRKEGREEGKLGKQEIVEI